MKFKLSIYPCVYYACFNGTDWDVQFIEHDHLSAEEESRLAPDAFNELMVQRNHIHGISMVNYTTQYGLGCFEGLKAFPQKDGRLKIFRPEKNSARMAISMRGLRMPTIPEGLLLDAIFEVVRRNRDIGFSPRYKTNWEKNIWQDADTVYIRPFAISEPGIGVNLSQKPWVVIICTTVSSYFLLGENNAVTSMRVRATPGGTGWIKTAANYVTSTLAKAEAMEKGYMEAIFLDALMKENIEEGSSCNFFATFPDNTIVTPALGDTILPGIIRESVIVLAKEMGYVVEEADLPISDVLNDAVECFVTGTAVGVTPLGSLTHKGITKKFSSLEPNSTANRLLRELKSIQFGATEDRHEWMKDVL